MHGVPGQCRYNSGMYRGLVLSDLHLYARRTHGWHLFASLHQHLRNCELLVLNGDTFDFQWTVLPNLAETVEAAARWLKNVAQRYPHCQIAVVLGNHDSHPRFINALGELASTTPNLEWHEHHLRVANALFLHGDCITRPGMGSYDLALYRHRWHSDRIKPRNLATAYGWVDRSGVSHVLPRLVYPRRKTARRILGHLDRVAPGVTAGVRDIYFGHTHTPFRDFYYRGFWFHNTGSGLHHRHFNVLHFHTDRSAVATSAD